MAPRTRNANRHEPNVENVIHTQSRWVLKGQICNLLTLTDVVPHQTAASNGMGNNNNNNNKKGENILEVWWEMWIIESNHSHTTYPISRSPFEWKWNYLYKPTITPPFLFFFMGFFGYEEKGKSSSWVARRRLKLSEEAEEVAHIFVSEDKLHHITGPAIMQLCTQRWRMTKNNRSSWEKTLLCSAPRGESTCRFTSHRGRREFRV